jgi:hypothetical protein
MEAQFGVAPFPNRMKTIVVRSFNVSVIAALRRFVENNIGGLQAPPRWLNLP